MCGSHLRRMARPLFHMAHRSLLNQAWPRFDPIAAFCSRRPWLSSSWASCMCLATLHETSPASGHPLWHSHYHGLCTHCRSNSPPVSCYLLFQSAKVAFAVFSPPRLPPLSLPARVGLTELQVAPLPRGLRLGLRISALCWCAEHAVAAPQEQAKRSDSFSVGARDPPPTATVMRLQAAFRHRLVVKSLASNFLFCLFVLYHLPFNFVLLLFPVYG